MKLAIVLMVMIFMLTSAAAKGGRGGGRSGGGLVTGGSYVRTGFFPRFWFFHTSHHHKNHTSHHKSNASALANPWSTSTILSLMSLVLLYVWSKYIDSIFTRCGLLCVPQCNSISLMECLMYTRIKFLLICTLIQWSITIFMTWFFFLITKHINSLLFILKLNWFLTKHLSKNGNNNNDKKVEERKV